MKISISYPPLASEKGRACLSQNRQFQWLNEPTYIYPVVLAYAATLLKKNGYEVVWDDAIAEGLSYERWKQRLILEQPDIIAIETKTPVIKKHWEIINELKEFTAGNDIWQPKIVLMGDHATALPEESLQNSKTDYVLTGGDYDFMLLDLADHMTKGAELEGGFYFRNEKGEAISSGPLNLASHDLNALPIIDRELTKWKMYAEKNGNFRHAPGAYIMSARDCWWGRCSFCSWNHTLFPHAAYRVMSAEKALLEVENLIKLGAKEIMEDSGTLPIGKWLSDFCRGMVEKGYNKKIAINCNMRLNAVSDPQIWRMMKEAGFRFVLFGLESANQETLDRINKNLKIEEIEPALKNCKEAGLMPHITAMFGYPWETREMAERTVKLAASLFKKGYIDTLQGTVVIPYPGTPLYEDCEKNDLLLTKDYDDFDQSRPVMESPLGDAGAMELVRKLFKACLTPKFFLRKIASIRNSDDFNYIVVRSGRKWLGKMRDFKK